MDLYRITRTDPRRHRPEVRYGTAKRVGALIREVTAQNRSRDEGKAWIDEHPDYVPRPGPRHWEHVTLTIECAEVVEWRDATSNFI